VTNCLFILEVAAYKVFVVKVIGLCHVTEALVIQWWDVEAAAATSCSQVLYTDALFFQSKL